MKTDVAATKSELKKTIADLKRTNGDLGVPERPHCDQR